MKYTRRAMHRRLAPPGAVLLLVLVAGGAAAQPPASPARPLNILLIIGDDMRWDAIGAAGNPVVRTPRLDRLAAEGVRFEQARVTSSVCMVSRATLLTGQYMSRHGITEFGRPIAPEAFASTFPGVLRRAGYWAGYVGKYGIGAPRAGDFDDLRAYEGTHWMAGPDGQRVHVTEKNARDAIEFLKTRPADKWYPYEESQRVPLVVRDPRLPLARRGTTRDELALNLDVAPTIVVAAGLKVPSVMQGQDLGPLYLAPRAPAWRDEFFYEHPTITSRDRIPSSQGVIRRDWKYVEWPEFNFVQLFDLRRDPGELANLAGQPAHATRQASLRQQLEAWRQRAR